MKSHNFPVHYYNQQAAGITCDIFQDWFNQKFNPELKSYLKKEKLLQKALIFSSKKDDVNWRKYKASKLQDPTSPALVTNFTT